METLRRSKRLKEKRDRFNDLPDVILLHIMSFMTIQVAAQTSLLSKRWNNLWKSMTDLTLHTCDFNDPLFFNQFVAGLVKCRDIGDHPLHTLVLKICNHYFYIRLKIMDDLLLHALSRNLQHLKLIVSCTFSLPDALFSCQSLISLHISVSPNHQARLHKYINLPELVDLHLERVGIYADENGHADPFWNCKKLITLHIDQCVLIYPRSISRNRLGTFHITSDTLTDLIIIHGEPTREHKYDIFAPKLEFILYKEVSSRPSPHEEDRTIALRLPQ